MTTPRKSSAIRMTEELSEKIEAIAKSKGVSKNAVMLEAIWQYVKSQKVIE